MKTRSALAPYFGDVADNPVALSERVDEFKKALDDAPWGVMDRGQMVAGNLKMVASENGSTGHMMEFAKADDHMAQLRSLLKQDTINKALGTERLAGIQAALADQGNISKDITLTSPVSSGMVLYDLKSPAEFLVPVETPIRNRFPRTKGTGTSFRYKQITGMTNAQTGSGAGILHPGITDTTQVNFANAGSSNALYFNRPPKITWTGQDVAKSYFQFGLSDEVTWSAYFAGVDFEDPRQLSQSGVLYASMLGEERMSATGRGPSSGSAGYGGPLTDASVAIAAATAGAGQTAVPGTPTVYVWVAANSGFASGGVANPSSRIPVATTPGNLTLSAGQVINGTITTGVPGAVYDVYVGTSAGAANAFYYGTFSGNFVVQGVLPTTGTAANLAADASFQANGYDGIFAISTSTAAGYTKYLNAAFSTTNPGTEFQTAFAGMYALNLANPDEIFMHSRDRKQLSDLLKISGTTGLRMVYEAESNSGKVLGEVVGGIQNESAPGGKIVDLTTHPYWVQGAASIVTHQLPFPNSNVPSCFEYRNVQDYMGIGWPQFQLSYDFSSYWYGTFFCHAPAWQGSLTGITAV